MQVSKTALIATSFLLAACAAQPKYNWGEYSPSLYGYYQDSTKEADYVAALDKIIKAEHEKKKIPPGILAEYGYVEFGRGNTDAAVALFEREKKAWPESSGFMDAAIKLARGPDDSKKPAGAPTTIKPTS